MLPELWKSKAVAIVVSKLDYAPKAVVGADGPNAVEKVSVLRALKKSKPVDSAVPKPVLARAAVVGASGALVLTLVNVTTERLKRLLVAHAGPAEQRCCSVRATDVPGATGRLLAAQKQVCAHLVRWNPRLEGHADSAELKNKREPARVLVSGVSGRLSIAPELENAHLGAWIRVPDRTVGYVV